MSCECKDTVNPIGNNNQSVNFMSPYIECMVQDIPVKCLIDTGACKSMLVSEHLCKVLGLTIQPKDIRLFGADKSPLNIIGTTELQVKFLCKGETNKVRLGPEFSEEAIVIEKLSAPVILGMDAINKLGITIDGKTQQMNIEECVLCSWETNSLVSIVSDQDVVFTPGEKRLVSVKVPTLIKGLYFISPIHQEVTNNLVGWEGVQELGINTNNNKIIVENQSQISTILKAGTEIAIAIPVEEEGHSVDEDTNIDIVAQIHEGDDGDNEVQIEDKKFPVKAGSLNRKQKRMLLKFINRNIKSFKNRITWDLVNSENLARLRVKPGSQPQVATHGRKSPKENKTMDDHVQELLSAGLVEPSSGEWRAPMLLVNKPDGTKRVTIDFRKLNDVTVKDVYPLPRIDEILDSMKGSIIFSKLDLTSGYWQVMLHPKDKKYTGFATKSGFYQWKVMPMGASNSGAIFQRIMNGTLRNLIGICVLVYIDDIIVYSNSFDEHLQHLQQVMDKLSIAKLYLKFSKCEFGMAEIEILGHLVSGKGVQPNPNKVEAIDKFPRPDTAVSRFLGMAGFYRRFIERDGRFLCQKHSFLKNGQKC